jgi:hypothetical protein
MATVNKWSAELTNVRKQSTRRKQSIRAGRGGWVGGWSLRTHREDVEERDEEERRVRPAGGCGGLECRQHERGVVHHRDLRDVHRGEVLRRPAAASSSSSSCSRCSLRTRAIQCLRTLRVPVHRGSRDGGTRMPTSHGHRGRQKAAAVERKGESSRQPWRGAVK